MKDRNSQPGPARYTWGTLVSPPEPHGYLILQWPLTRAPEAWIWDTRDYYLALQAMCSGVTATYAKQAGEEYGLEDIERRMAWHKERPPLGYPDPRWRFQWPVRRVPAGRKLVTGADLAADERAMWDGARAGMAIEEPPWAADFAEWRASLVRGYVPAAQPGAAELADQAGEQPPA
jgi:hypothetical protein